MGCCSSFDVYDLENVRKYRRQFEALQLTRSDVNKLYKIFRKADVDGSGSIALIELLCHVDVERTPFTERVFSIFDEDGSGEIDFREFVLALWNYCTLSRATLDLFAFDLYDRDSSGEMSPQEVQRMLKDIYGKSVATNHHARAITADLKVMEKDGEINAEQFCKFAKTHHALLFPAFEMQQLLQRRTLGSSFWYKNSERRIEVSKGRFIPIAKFMELHLNKTLLHQTVNSPAVVTAEVRSEAKIALSVTGTKQMRVAQSQKKKEEAAISGVTPDYVVMPFDDNNPNGRPLHSHQHHIGGRASRKTDLDIVHESINNHQTAKVIGEKTEPSLPQGAVRRRSSISVVPDFSSVKTASNVLIDVPDDGNPSAKLPLFSDFSAKSNNSDGGAGGSNRKRRHSIDGQAGRNNLSSIAETSISVSSYSKSGVAPPTPSSAAVEHQLKPQPVPKPKPHAASAKEANDHYLNAFKPPSEKEKAKEAELDQPVDPAPVKKGGGRRRSLG